MASELGLDPKLARRAGLLHDIGKAMDHETEGSHALIGAETARRLERWRPQDREQADPDSLAWIALSSQDAWARLVFRRDVSLDQFLGGIDENMRRARDAGLITPEGYERVAADLPVSYAPLAADGITEGDRILYRVRGDTLRTVYQRGGGELVVDQTHIGPERRLSLLGSFFVKGSDFRKGLVESLPHAGEE